MKQVLETVQPYMQAHHMVEEGDTICVGVSGGADSVCLLLLLAMLPQISLCAVHVQHGLRPEADEEEAFVRALCEERKIPLYTYRFPVADWARDAGMGIEESARLARQEAYADCVRCHGVTKIALAHQANDRAETFLFHAARGSSLSGLASIRPVRQLTVGQEGKDQQMFTVIRPLLAVPRREIEEALRRMGQPWCSDASNADTQYTRNAIRHQVIPVLEAEQPQGVVHLAAAAADLEEADRFFREEAEKRLAIWRGTEAAETKRSTEGGTAAPETNTFLLPDSFTEENPLLQGYLVLSCLEKLAGRRKDLGREQVEQIRMLFDKPVGSRFDLPYRLEAVRGYREVRLRHRQEETEETPDPLRNWQFFSHLRNVEPGSLPASAIPSGRYTKWLDYDRMKHDLAFRTRRSGDFLRIDAEGNTKRLKEYLIEQKVPREERDMLPLLASGSEVYWVVGHRISETCKITEQTTRILELQAVPPETHEADTERENHAGKDQRPVQ